MNSPWTVVNTIEADGFVPASEVAGIASLIMFDCGALAVAETPVPGDRIQQVAGFGSENQAEMALEALSLQLPAVSCAIRADEGYRGWIQSQRDGLRPTTVGSFTIRAPWHEPSAVPDLDVIIDPGGAFGHGAHPSTHLALELLIRWFESSDTSNNKPVVVDLGTGTGVIAIVAARLGNFVRATEYDADALSVAATNIAANHVSGQIELIGGNAAESRIDTTDLVVANMTLDVHREVAENYAAARQIIVAGLLCSQVGAMRELLPNHCARTIRTRGEWAAIGFAQT